MTVADIQSYVKTILGSSSDPFYTDAEILTVMNAVVPLMAVRIEEMITWVEWALVADTQAYTLPEDWIAMEHIEVIDSNDTNRTWQLYPLSIKEFNKVARNAADQTDSDPAYYRLEIGPINVNQDPQRVGEIYLYPTPSTAHTLRMWYYRRPNDCSATTDIPELPLHYHEAICIKTAHRLATKGKEYQLADRLLRDYEMAMTELTQSAKNMKRRDHIARTKDVMGYGDIDL